MFNLKALKPALFILLFTHFFGNMLQKQSDLDFTIKSKC